MTDERTTDQRVSGGFSALVRPTPRFPLLQLHRGVRINATISVVFPNGRFRFLCHPPNPSISAVFRFPRCSRKSFHPDADAAASGCFRSFAEDDGFRQPPPASDEFDLDPLFGARLDEKVSHQLLV
jgi:hypothetical protein